VNSVTQVFQPAESVSRPANRNVLDVSRTGMRGVIYYVMWLFVQL